MLGDGFYFVSVPSGCEYTDMRLISSLIKAPEKIQSSCFPHMEKNCSYNYHVMCVCVEQFL